MYQDLISAKTPSIFHPRLAHFNHSRLAVSVPSASWEDDLPVEFSHRMAEGEYIESLRAEVAHLLPDADIGAAEFVRWFESLLQTGPGQQHPLFDWLAESAALEQMRWFLTQEAAGEIGFDDLVACTQVRLPPRAKLECARNYWDEMGHGKETAMHGHLLERMVETLGLRPQIDSTVWESLALSNTMLALALNRRYTYHSLGALGAIELTAPQRVKKISIGMKRLGLDGRVRAYFDLHAALDVSHARQWISEIIFPLVEAEPECARFIAEGALMRLRCGARCFDRYSSELQIGSSLQQGRDEPAMCC